MDRFLTRLVGILGVTAALVASAQPKSFRYLAEGLPKTGASCADEAARVAETFKRQTGVALAHGRCLRESAKAMDLEVTYVAEWRLEPHSTIEYAVGIPSSYQGTYSTARACLADLPSQSRLYRDHTGIEPLVAYCYRESKEKRNAYVLRIDGFGKAVREPRIRNLQLFGDPEGNPDTLQARVLSYFRAKVPDLSSAVLRSYVLDHAVRVVYYGEKVIPIRADELGTYRDRARCLRSLQTAEARLAQMTEPPPLMCVHSELLARYSLQLVQVKEGDYLRPIPYTEIFADYASCESHAPKALAETAEAFDGEGVATICHEASGEVRMTVLIR